MLTILPNRWRLQLKSGAQKSIKGDIPPVLEQSEEVGGRGGRRFHVCVQLQVFTQSCCLPEPRCPDVIARLRRARLGVQKQKEEEGTRKEKIRHRAKEKNNGQNLFSL